MSNRLVGTSGALASVSAAPKNTADVLVDSGATNHVTSHRSLFINFTSANSSLRVASEERISVDGVGTINIPTQHGIITLSNVLYCPGIKGTVLSVGYFN
jgi:hypothetical protein